MQQHTCLRLADAISKSMSCALSTVNFLHLAADKDLHSLAAAFSALVSGADLEEHALIALEEVELSADTSVRVSEAAVTKLSLELVLVRT